MGGRIEMGIMGKKKRVGREVMKYMVSLRLRVMGMRGLYVLVNMIGMNGGVFYGGK